MVSMKEAQQAVTSDSLEMCLPAGRQLLSSSRSQLPALTGAKSGRYTAFSRPRLARREPRWRKTSHWA